MHTDDSEALIAALEQGGRLRDAIGELAQADEAWGKSFSALVYLIRRGDAPIPPEKYGRLGTLLVAMAKDAAEEDEEDRTAVDLWLKSHDEGEDVAGVELLDEVLAGKGQAFDIQGFHTFEQRVLARGRVDALDKFLRQGLGFEPTAIDGVSYLGRCECGKPVFGDEPYTRAGGRYWHPTCYQMHRAADAEEA